LVDQRAQPEEAVVTEERLRVIVHLPVGHEDEELAAFEILDFLKRQKEEPAEPAKVMGFTYSAFAGSDTTPKPGGIGGKGPVFQGMWWDAAVGPGKARHQARSIAPVPCFSCELSGNRSRSQSERAGADQVGKSAALIAIQDRVDLLQGLEHRVTHVLGALDTQFTSRSRPGGVEGVASQSVGERRQGSVPVHFGLGTFGLELVQDAG
jgi:hypothetical protein